MLIKRVGLRYVKILFIYCLQYFNSNTDNNNYNNNSNNNNTTFI